MSTVAPAEAKTHLLDQLEAGEEVVITRRGQPVARIILKTAVDRFDDFVACWMH